MRGKVCGQQALLLVGSVEDRIPARHLLRQVKALTDAVLVAAFRVAAERLRNGDLRAKFPEGSFPPGSAVLRLTPASRHHFRRAQLLVSGTGAKLEIVEHESGSRM